VWVGMVVGAFLFHLPQQGKLGEHRTYTAL
jgi:hypothetical protein